MFDRSFATFAYNARHITVEKSNFIRFYNSVINVDSNENNFQFNGYFQSEINLNDLKGNINIANCLFYNLLNSAIRYTNYANSLITIFNSSFINFPSGGTAIVLNNGASLFTVSSCFYSFTNINSVCNIAVFLNNPVHINMSSFCKIYSSKNLIDCSNCSFNLNNVNFSSNTQISSSLMRFNNVNHCNVFHLNLYKSISYEGITYSDHIDTAIFNMMHVYNRESGVYVFNIPKGSIYVYHSTFDISISSYLVKIYRSSAFFYNCIFPENLNIHSQSNMIRTFECKYFKTNQFVSPNPNSYAHLYYCENGVFPNAEELMIATYAEKEKVIKYQQKGATEILGIILVSALGVVIIGLSLWLLFYFVICKNPLREFNKEDDQLGRWKHRWEWIKVNSNKAFLEHRECSDIVLDPIELSEVAVKRRHMELSDVDNNNFSDSQKLGKDDFATFLTNRDIEQIKSRKLKKSEFNDYDDLDDKIKSEGKDESTKIEPSESSKTQKQKNNPKKKIQRHYTGAISAFNDKDQKKNALQKKKSFKKGFSSSDDNKEKVNQDVDDEMNKIISESDDLDDDNEKIRNNLEKTLSNWNKFTKTGIDKSLGVVDDDSESSFELKSKKIPLLNLSISDSNSSSGTWTDNGDDDGKDSWTDYGDEDDEGDEGDDEDDSSSF